MKINSEILKVSRAKSGLSKSAVARQTGINRKKYSINEGDPGEFTTKELLTLSKVLNFDIKDIFLS